MKVFNCFFAINYQNETNKKVLLIHVIYQLEKISILALNCSDLSALGSYDIYRLSKTCFRKYYP
jgi:hypothetical protein